MIQAFRPPRRPGRPCQRGTGRVKPTHIDDTRGTCTLAALGEIVARIGV